MGEGLGGAARKKRTTACAVWTLLRTRSSTWKPGSRFSVPRQGGHAIAGCSEIRLPCGLRIGSSKVYIHLEHCRGPWRLLRASFANLPPRRSGCKRTERLVFEFERTFRSASRSARILPAPEATAIAPDHVSRHGDGQAPGEPLQRRSPASPRRPWGQASPTTPPPSGGRLRFALHSVSMLYSKCFRLRSTHSPANRPTSSANIRKWFHTSHGGPGVLRETRAPDGRSSRTLSASASV